MNGDTVFNFGLGTTIDILGAQIGRAHLVRQSLCRNDHDRHGPVAAFCSSAAYADGDFMSVVRGRARAPTRW